MNIKKKITEALNKEEPHKRKHLKKQIKKYISVTKEVKRAINQDVSLRKAFLGG